MRKQIFEFGNNIFRDELWNEYIVPVSEWFLAEDFDSGYLLPKTSGSVWECSLAIDFLLKVYMQEAADVRLKNSIKTKVVNTVRWLENILELDDDGIGMSWDNAPWDTAVALKNVLSCIEIFRNAFSNEELNSFETKTFQVCKWLIHESKNWKSSEGYYTADAPDLAVSLTTFIILKEKFPNQFNDIENEMLSSKEKDIITTIVDMLVAAVINREENSITVQNWGSSFNVGEVVCALCNYLAYDSSNNLNKNLIESIVLESLKYIETNCKSGIETNSVADVCGIMWCYLLSSRIFINLYKQTSNHNTHDIDDTLVFKLLCYVCDSNRVMKDGSFLHSSYVTVFYSLSLIETYISWNLGNKPTNKIYDYFVWANSNIETLERAKRLDLELQLKKNSEELIKLQNKHNEKNIKKVMILFFIVLIILSFFTLQLSGAISFINIDLKIYDLNLLISIIGIIIAVIPGCLKIVYEVMKKKIRGNNKGS